MDRQQFLDQRQKESSDAMAREVAEMDREFQSLQAEGGADMRARRKGRREDDRARLRRALIHPFGHAPQHAARTVAKIDHDPLLPCAPRRRPRRARGTPFGARHEKMAGDRSLALPLYGHSRGRSTLSATFPPLQGAGAAHCMRRPGRTIRRAVSCRIRRRSR